MKEKEYLYNLLYSALVQIRADAHERKDKKNFRICDLLHNVPLKLLKATDTHDYKKIFEELNSYVDSSGMRPWLDSEIKEIDKMKTFKSNDSDGNNSN